MYIQRPHCFCHNKTFFNLFMISMELFKRCTSHHGTEMFLNTCKQLSSALQINLGVKHVLAKRQSFFGFP